MTIAIPDVVTIQTVPLIVSLVAVLCVSLVAQVASRRRSRRLADEAAHRRTRIDGLGDVCDAMADARVRLSKGV